MTPARGFPSCVAAGMLVLMSAVLVRSQGDATGSILAAIQSRPELSTLAAVVEAAELSSTLSDATLTYTVFAPNNEAFAALLTTLRMTAPEVLALGKELQPVLLQHVLTTAVPSSALPEGTTEVDTANANGPLSVTRAAGTVSVKSIGADATVVTADVAAGGSVIHVVNAVLLPFYTSLAAAAVRNPDSFSVLLQAVQAANLTEALSDPSLSVTLFAPTNDAFNKTLSWLGLSLETALASPDVLTAILAHHVVPSAIPSTAIPPGVSNLTTWSGPNKPLQVTAYNGAVGITSYGGVNASVITVDVPVGLGPRSYIHVVDSVLIPYYTYLAEAARKLGLRTLVAAVRAAGAATIGPQAPITLLAPTDEAWAAFAKSKGVTVDQLLAQPAVVYGILGAHVLPGSARADDISDGQVIVSVYNYNITAHRDGSGLSFSIDGSRARVIQPDVAVNLGTAYLHIVDAILLPDGVTVGVPPSPAARKRQPPPRRTLKPSPRMYLGVHPLAAKPPPRGRKMA
ncbi:hypothetical protein HYH03_003592 [Edaphochlamys debaryana]|uniref:FAS1 domain-containing protein n=1 Tax=Edaphochlamys debaryana TaxID=47281 RepID=A0A835Y8Q2_9CHLO|nr:hypothetical protein HYH03_003592 [Edaphochlamys debaryana]|eukprot:KAG2498332.1 hypothetical protein HYH03_003592 [Edaphochlamys debaryana]